MLTAYKTGSTGNFSQYFDMAINETVRNISASVRFVKGENTIDVSDRIKSIDVSGETKNKMILAGAIAHAFTLEMSVESDDEFDEIYSLINSGAVVVGEWKTTSGNDEYYVPFPVMFPINLNRDIVTNSIILDCTDAIGIASRKKLSDVSGWETKTILTITRNLDFFGIPVTFIGGTPLGGASLCGDIFNSDSTFRDLIDARAFCSAMVANAENESNSTIRAVIRFRDVSTNETRKPVITPITHSAITNSGAVLNGNIDSTNESISFSLKNANGYMIAEDTVSGNALVKIMPEAFKQAYITALGIAYNTNNAKQECFITHRGNPRLQAGDYLSVNGETEEAFVTTNSFHFDGGLTGISNRDFDGIGDSGNIDSAIGQNRTLTEMLYAQIDALRAEIDAYHEQRSGNATINTTYAGTSSARRVTWIQVGKVVTVWFYDIQQTASVTSSTNCILASGLPRAKFRSIGMILRHEDAKACRIGIEAGSTDVVYWWTSTGAKSAMSGQMTYIAE